MATAAKLFLKQGYEGTSMDQVAAAAGAGKQSLYRRYANKEVLFKVVFTEFVMKDMMVRCNEQIALQRAASDSGSNDCLEELKKVALFAFNFMLDPTTLEGLRLFVAERRRFPDLKQDVEQMTQSLQALISERIFAAQKAGLFRSELNPNVALSFVSLVAEGPALQALLDLPSVSTPAKREAYFESAWKTFIDSVTPLASAC